MRIVAYYHEEIDGNVTRKSVGLERRETVVDEPCVLEREAWARVMELTDSRDFWRDKAIAAEAKLAALKAQEPVADEREEFERWIADEAGPHALKKWPTDSSSAYENDRVQDYRAGWIECLNRMRAAPVVSAEQQGVADSVSYWIDRLENYGDRFIPQLLRELKALPTICKGANCTSTDGQYHSPECISEHNAAINGKGGV